MKAAKTPKKLKEMPYPPQKEAFKKKRKQYYTNNDKCPNFTNLFRTSKSDQRKIALYEVNFVVAGKISTIFYQ